MRRQPKWAVYVLAVLCNLFWAGAYVTGKVAIGTPEAPGFGPFKAAFFRFGVAGAALRVIVTYEFLLGSLLLAPFAVWETVTNGPVSPTPAAWGAFLYLLGPCTVIAYTVWFMLLEVADASELSVFIFLQPVAGTLMGVFWFRDPFTALTALGGALVLIGVACITRPGATREQVSSVSEKMPAAGG